MKLFYLIGVNFNLTYQVSDAQMTHNNANRNHAKTHVLIR